LDHESLARYLVYVTAKEWVEKMRLFRSSGKQICLEPDIYLFGKPSNGKHLGRVLSDLGLFLQPPDFLDTNVMYENPHEIKFPSWSETDPEAVVPPLCSLSVSKLSTDAVDCVLRELHQQELLDVVDVDKNIILTELER
jgi:SWI/SNF-related matrix-associated actin-dependent regulator of chromatin subfamily A3